MKPGEIWRLVKISWNPISYYIRDEENRILLYYLDDDEEYEDYDRTIKIGEFLTNAIRTLSPRERTVIKQIFRLQDGVAPKSLLELGKDLSLTRQRIQQIEKTALKKIEGCSKGDELKSFFDTLNICL